MYNDDLLKKVLAMTAEDMVKQAFKNVEQKKDATYEEMEYSEYSCKASITDVDMMPVLIDHALDTGNKELFMQLTKEGSHV